VDVSDNSVDSTLVVTITSPVLYLDFCCRHIRDLAEASQFLRWPPSDGSLSLGTFCGVLSVELDSFAKEPGTVYLSVTKRDHHSMAYCLHREDRAELATSLTRVVALFASEHDEIA